MSARSSTETTWSSWLPAAVGPPSRQARAGHDQRLPEGRSGGRQVGP
jgi:hypothetical protein